MPDITIENEHGQIYGYVHHKRLNLKNWLTKIRAENLDSLDILSDAEILPVAILKNINVEPQYQGLGYGTDLLEKFIDQACLYEAQTIIVEVYADEAKRQMDLYNFYSKYGFELLPGSARVMVLYL